MVTIPVKTRLEADGILNLRRPTGLTETDVEVVIVVQPLGTSVIGWQADFFQETDGAFAGHHLERGNQEASEDREVLR